MEKRSRALRRLEPGECFAGKYVVERVLGSGGMSVVFAALHQGLRQKVAIKLISGTAELPADTLGRFLREARAAAALRSEYTARVVDVDVDEGGRHFIVMEHLEGEDLGDVLRRTPMLPIETAVGYVLHACEAMAEAHSLGIIHRDLKPQNLFLTWRIDGTPLVKVLDFGVSKVLASEAPSVTHSSLSAPNVLLGTPHYMAPEQIRTPAAIDGRCDVWALGVTLFELLTHQEPFAGATLPDVIAAVLQNAPRSAVELRPEIPEALAAVLLACLEKEESRRIANVGILARALRPWAPVWALDAAARAERICGAEAMSSVDPAARSAEPGAWAVPREPSESQRTAGTRPGRGTSLRRALYLGVAAGMASSAVFLGTLILKPPVPTASAVAHDAVAHDAVAHDAVGPRGGARLDALVASAAPSPLSSELVPPPSQGAESPLARTVDPSSPALSHEPGRDAPPAPANAGDPRAPVGVAPGQRASVRRATQNPKVPAARKAAIVRVAERPFPSDPLVGRR